MRRLVERPLPSALARWPPKPSTTAMKLVKGVTWGIIRGDSVGAGDIRSVDHGSYGALYYSWGISRNP